MKTEILRKMKNHRNIIKLSLWIFLILMTKYGVAQGEYIEVRDLETWSSVNLKYKVNKTWKMSFQGQLRLENNSSEVSQYFGQYDLTYSPFKHFSLACALRFVRKNDNTGNIQGYENHFRYHLDGIFKHKSQRFRFKYRLRYQNKNELGVEDEARQYIRLKAGAEYNIRKWKLDPDVSGELFNRLGTEDNQLEGYRFTLGTSFKVHKAGKIGVFYRYEEEFNTSFPKSRNIIGFKYTYSLK